MNSVYIDYFEGYNMYLMNILYLAATILIVYVIRFQFIIITADTNVLSVLCVYHIDIYIYIPLVFMTSTNWSNRGKMSLNLNLSLYVTEFGIITNIIKTFTIMECIIVID